MHILHVMGARPNFIKAAPVMSALASSEDVRQTLVHTGQHYDANMSDVFFRQLNIADPDINLGVGSGSHAYQTAEVMRHLESVVQEREPDLVLVYGDVNSTMAAALVCAKLLIPVGHVEAGLRSFDRTMPEEINRLITDQISDLLFTPSADADANLSREGVAAEQTYLVGNVMIDTLVRLLPEAPSRWKGPALRRWAGRPYALVTLHRPSNVDDETTMRETMDALADISRDILTIFPVHPRTRLRLPGLGTEAPDLNLVEPFSYLDFLALQRDATLVITDSGGIQEETTFLGIPCLTLRENTERPITVTSGTNTLVGHDMDQLRSEVAGVLAGNYRKGQVPPLWDGQAADRIVNAISSWWGAGRLARPTTSIGLP